MRAFLATISRPQGILSGAVCVSFSPSAFTFDTEPHNQLCNLASFDATLNPRTNSHTHEMYYQRFVGLSAQLREKQGLQTSTSSSTLTFFLSSLVARAPPRAQVHNAAATGEPGSIPGSRLASWVAARAARERARGARRAPKLCIFFV